jgi:peptide/nickel transport system substrate-binding protein
MSAPDISRRHFVQGAIATPFITAVPQAFAQSDRRPLLTIAVPENPAGLEPAMELSNPGTRVTYSVFDTLIRRDFMGSPDGGGSELKPHLATSWERKGPSELIVTLRQGVKFHNGDEMTADDVAFTFSEKRMWGDKSDLPEARAYFGVLSACEALDKYTVRFQTRVPDVLLEQRLASWCAWVVNKRHYEALGRDRFAKSPVGTGPFRFVSMSAKDHITFAAFDDYFMGRPNARGVIFKVIPELAARIAGLVSGEFQLITNVPPDQVQVIKGYKGIEARSVALANSHLLTFDVRGEWTSDKRVRQALSMAVDRKKLVDSLWLGKAVIPGGHNYPEYGRMYLEGRTLPFNPEKAKALLKEAGYNGSPIVYRTMPNYYTNALDAAQIIVEMWKAVGVNAQLQVVENFAQMRAKGQQVGNNSNSTRLPDPLGALWVSYGPSSYFQQSGEFTDHATFNAIGRALEQETDWDKRKALFAQLLDAWEDACPATILYQPFETYGVASNVKWTPYSFYFMDLRPDNLSFV